MSRASLVAAAFAFALPGLASADEAGSPAPVKSELVEEILVKGRKQTRVDTMEVREVRETPAHDLGEALAQQGLAAAVRKGGIAADVVVRGFQRDNVSVAIDGAKLHGACPNRMDPPSFHVDYAEVERVEVRKGPFDVASPGGLGAALEVHTREPGVGTEGELTFGYGRFGSFEASASAAHGTESYGLLAGGALKSSRPFESGDGLRFTEIYPATSPSRYRARATDQAAYEVATGWAKGSWSPAPGQRARLSYTLQAADHVLYPYLRMDATRDDTSRVNASYELGAVGPIARVRAQAYFTNVVHDMDDARRCSSFATNVPGTTTPDCGTVLPEGWSMRTEAESWVAGGAVEAVIPSLGETTAGVDFSLRAWNANTTRYRRAGTVGYFEESSIPDVRTTDVGLRVQHDLPIGERLVLRGGLRLDLARSEPGEDRSAEYAKYHAGLPAELRKEDVFVSGNVQADVRVTRALSAFAAFGRGARLPDAQERYFALSPMGPTAAGGVGLPLLRPVRNDELDLGVKLVLGPALVKVQYFHSWLTDWIALVDLAQLATPTLHAKSYANVDGFLWGGEASARVALPLDLYLSATAAYAEGRNTTADAWLQEIPPLRASAALRYDVQRWFLEVETVMAADQDKVDASVNEAATAGWAIVNLEAGVHVKGARLYGGVRNVFDRSYTESLSYLRDPFASGIRVPEPGRTVYASAQYRF